MSDNNEIITGSSTEEKIKEAARRVFTRKGYAATRTRDIAEESGFNLALINYYFRSKENLFNLIMVDNFKLFMNSIAGILNDRNTSLEQKLEALVIHYIDMLLKHPDIPIFILTELNAHPEEILKKLSYSPDIHNTFMAQQWVEVMSRKPFKVNPVHLAINLISLIIFPFAARPIMKVKMQLDNDEFLKIMEERKKLIPIWVKSMLETM